MSSAGDRMRRYADRAATEGGRQAAEAMADVGQRYIRRELSQRSHAPETRTPSAPGEAPARVSGALWRSISVWPAIPAGGYRWMSQAGSRGLIYADVQERGRVIRVRRAPWLVWVTDGIVRRARQVYVPPRPYVAPGARKARESGEVERAGVEAFHRAVYG